MVSTVMYNLNIILFNHTFFMYIKIITLLTNYYKCLIYCINYLLQLSSYVTQCLHAMVDFVLQRDFNSAFNLHTQLVSGPEFSKISTFMPSLKALVQMTYQYNVNLQGL